ncbi:hypothetical protein BASA61_007516 [Batrachochytrium salamandrivorans]|nr:hypothetical protein BASA62_007908 [Batrachochytrium salamandrivorans]KAH6583349.1 hypothetical protein BASA61_008059 [Batrachochytrium salamandrivorans]KAH6583682.1 hypothetical protein BASA60_001327 [Batrachochytrium salamandrivorans]KAH6584351.1 hypothetical protein BASA61_007516 [Batrachochytrium salamandrivorans]KAH9257388.1 hypothetical protein BASA81_004546 [Batrachochytrium salamandrivorans]
MGRFSVHAGGHPCAGLEQTDQRSTAPMPVDTLLAMSATAATPKSPNDAQSQTLPSICDSPVALSPGSSPTTLINNALSGDPATASAAYKGPSVYCSASFISSAVLSLAQKLVLPIVNVVHDVSRHYSQELYLRMTGTRNRVRYYRHLVDIANSYEQWAAAGYMLDRYEGSEVWKHTKESPHYDYKLINDRLKRLQLFRNGGLTADLMRTLRSSLTRSIGDMGNPHLYGNTHVGTKVLIEDYINEVTKQLNFIGDNVNEVTTPVKIEYFTDMQKSFGRTALLLSGGATFGLVHIGTIKALYEMRLLPRIITGASCGAIIAAAVCTNLDEELHKILDPEVLNIDVFETPREQGNILFRIVRLLKHGVLFDVEVITESMRCNLGDITFQEAFNRSRRILNITVSSSTNYEMPRLLNYLTAPNVLVWSAVAASCAVPFIYRSAPLMAKDKSGATKPWNPSGHRWIDGSVESDLPMQRISELFGVNHFIVAQVNPHVIPFMSWSNRAPSAFTSFVVQLGQLTQKELLHRLTQLDDLGIQDSYLSRIKSIICQKYWGDITIVPHLPWRKFARVLSNPTVDMVIDYTIDGERAIWPQIAIMRNHLQIELCLNQNILDLRERKFDKPVPKAPSPTDSVVAVEPRPTFSFGAPLVHSKTMQELRDFPEERASTAILQRASTSKLTSSNVVNLGADLTNETHGIGVRRNIRSSSDMRGMKTFD